MLPDADSGDLTQDAARQSEVFVAVYEELRRVAHGLMRGEWAERSLDPTGLVNEAVLRLLGGPLGGGTMDRRYIFAAAVRAMRQILVERARTRKRLKRGGGWERVPLDDVIDALEAQQLDVLDLHDAIERLVELDARQAQMVTMRYILRMQDKEIAAHFDVSLSTVESELRLARAWLRRTLSGPDEPGPGTNPKPTTS